MDHFKLGKHVPKFVQKANAGSVATCALLQLMYENPNLLVADNLKPGEEPINCLQLSKEIKSRVLEASKLEAKPTISSSRPLGPPRLEKAPPFYIVPPGFTGTRRALLIGVVAGEGDDLKGPPNDITNIQQFLTKHCGFLPKNISVLQDFFDTPSSVESFKQNILDGFGKLTQESQPNDVCFIQFSGHGGRVGNSLYILPSDYDTAGQIMDQVILRDLIKKMPAQVYTTMLVDCCFSGTVGDLPYILQHNSNGTQEIDSYYDTDDRNEMIKKEEEGGEEYQMKQQARSQKRLEDRVGGVVDFMSAAAGYDATAWAAKKGYAYSVIAYEKAAPMIKEGYEKSAVAAKKGYEASAKASAEAYKKAAPVIRDGYEKSAVAAKKGYEKSAVAAKAGYEKSAVAAKVGYEKSAVAAKKGYEASAKAASAGYAKTASVMSERGKTAAAAMKKSGTRAAAATKSALRSSTSKSVTSPAKEEDPSTPDGADPPTQPDGEGLDSEGKLPDEELDVSAVSRDSTSSATKSSRFDTSMASLKRGAASAANAASSAARNATSSIRNSTKQEVDDETKSNVETGQLDMSAVSNDSTSSVTKSSRFNTGMASLKSKAALAANAASSAASSASSSIRKATTKQEIENETKSNVVDEHQNDPGSDPGAGKSSKFNMASLKSKAASAANAASSAASSATSSIRNAAAANKEADEETDVSSKPADQKPKASKFGMASLKSAASAASSKASTAGSSLRKTGMPKFGKKSS